jgi:hypothetical protein
MTPVRFPSHVSIVQHEFADDPPAAFKPPPPTGRRVISVGSTGCTLTRDFPADDGGPIEDPHYGPQLRNEREAREQARLARDSILRPESLARLTPGRDDR